MTDSGSSHPATLPFALGAALGSALGLVLGSLLALWFGPGAARAVRARMQRLRGSRTPNFELLMQ